VQRVSGFILLAALLVAGTTAYALTPVVDPVPAVPGPLTGGPAVSRVPVDVGYDPVAYLTAVASRVDANGNGVEDELEAKLGLLGDERVSVNVVFAAVPAALGGDADALREGLEEAISVAEDLGGRVNPRKVWVNAIVGFNVVIPADAVEALAEALSQLDVDGLGDPELVLVTEDRQVKALNYWSSRQVAARPWVWQDLKVTGAGVTVAVLDTGIDGNNSAFADKIVYWADYTGDPNGVVRDEPYDDNLHGTHVAGTVAGVLSGLDPDGRLVMNFGLSDLDSSSWPTGQWLAFRAPYTAYYVNATGTIEINFKWKGDTTSASTEGSIAAVGIAYCGPVTLAFCDYTDNVVAWVETPDPDTWYTVTYEVTGPDQFGFYTMVFQVGEGGGIAMLPIMRWPVSTDYVADDQPYLAGMAPGASLGGAKVLSYAGSGSTSDIVSAIDDVVGNKTAVDPPMFIISMSLGGGYDATLDAAVTNAVQAGIVVVVAAGNDGPGTETAATGSPANNPYAITVAALDALNNVTDYSSDGGESTSDSVDSGDTYIKPDIAAPGGGSTLMIISADTTWHDDLLNAYYRGFWAYEDVDWPDTINLATVGYDDGIGISGTSMATPHVSGIAALVISALINNASYTYTWDAASALFVKNIILISAYETYPLIREFNETYSPTLDKGGKDVHEGYGAIDAYAAVLLAITMGEGKALLPGSIVSGELRPGVIYGSSGVASGSYNVPFGHNVYAWRVHAVPYVAVKLPDAVIIGEINYTVTLVAQTSDPDNTDFDLYVYNITPNKYGEPIIITSSTEGMGTTIERVLVRGETINSTNGDFIVAVKRAREDSAGGAFTLIIGPYAKLTGYDDFGNPVEGQAYTGRDLTIELLFASAAANATIVIVDNTTGTILDEFNITLEQANGYSTAVVNWTVPADSTLDGHTLVVVAFPDTYEGPAVATATAVASAVPIPEGGAAPIAAVLAAIAAVLVLARRK